jgi:hypothetical protein
MTYFFNKQHFIVTNTTVTITIAATATATSNVLALLRHFLSCGSESVSHVMNQKTCPCLSVLISVTGVPSDGENLTSRHDDIGADL